ncbi:MULTISPECIES: DUF2637 domain-containing protein [Actinomadura]|uniref:DUF2637 domain-containing protein n=1 Tax=Actinomadura TaxID=1988 RepID=UPI0009DD0A50|nr:DUF2637 domain-containing protein [Actinomadura madurae]
MANAKPSHADQVIRSASTVSVIVLAGIAAVISYKHMYQLVLQDGETSWTAALLSVSVDGMIVVASMSLLVDSRQGRSSRLLPWTLLVLGSAASLAANVAVAEPSLVGRLIAAWPSCALIGAYEPLDAPGQERFAAEEVGSYEALTTHGNSPDGFYDAQTSGAANFLRGAEKFPAGEDSGEAKGAFRDTAGRSRGCNARHDSGRWPTAQRRGIFLRKRRSRSVSGAANVGATGQTGRSNRPP